MGDVGYIDPDGYLYLTDRSANLIISDGVNPSPELAEELIEHCRAHLAHFKCPRRVEFTAVLPREDNGKIYERRLRDEFRKDDR